jgi:hypothetical protein
MKVERSSTFDVGLAITFTAICREVLGLVGEVTVAETYGAIPRGSILYEKFTVYTFSGSPIVTVLLA